MDEPFERLAWARVNLGRYSTASEAARAMGAVQATYTSHENGTRGLTPDAARRYANFYRISPEWLLFGFGRPRPDIDAPDLARAVDAELFLPSNQSRPAGQVVAAAASRRVVGPNAGAPSAAELPRKLLPVYGLAAGGEDGRFILNGQRIADVLCPPGLELVPNAYAVYINGESMEPRYFAGETAWVNPAMPIRRGDFVVVQIQGEEGEPPSGYVKRYVGKREGDLVLEQLNPAGELTFPLTSVISIHKIMFSGQS